MAVAVVVGFANAANAQVAANSSPTVVPANVATEAVSRTQGYFIGGQFEGDAVKTTYRGTSTSEAGEGFGIVFGYGITKNVATYVHFSAANVKSADGDLPNYGWGNMDYGVRIHLMQPTQKLRPYVQAGLSTRALQMNFDDGSKLKGNGIGVAFGGGINYHLTPVAALTAGVVWSTGQIGNWTLDNDDIGGDRESVTSARVQVGFVFFPQRGK
jgi:hypothetical protein